MRPPPTTGSGPPAAREPVSLDDETAPAPLNDADLARLEHLLSNLESPLQPLDLSALDGYLCGVLLQPRAAPLAQWWPHVVDVQGRAVPDTATTRELQQLVLRRHGELSRAISRRQWFDPWIFADDEADAAEAAEAANSSEPGDEEAPAAAVQAVLPWVAGFAAAMEHFPQLMDRDDPELVEPLALLFMHFNPDDLEDADALLAMIETLEPPADLAEAVQDIVRALMLIADVARPQSKAGTAAPASRPPRPRRTTGATHTTHTTRKPR